MNYYHAEDQYLTIFQTLLLSGEYEERDIEAKVFEILENPEKYPEYFE